MVQWHTRSLRKSTGGLDGAVNARNKKAFEKGGVPADTRIDAFDHQRKVRMQGGRTKQKQLAVSAVMVCEPGSGKTMRVKLVRVRENTANRQFARRNVVTKGAIVEVEWQNATRLARVTSRPGQSGGVCAVLLGAEDAKAFEAPLSEKKRKTRSAKGTKHAKKGSEAVSAPTVKEKSK